MSSNPLRTGRLKPDDAEFFGLEPWCLVEVIQVRDSQLIVRLPDGRTERIPKWAVVAPDAPGAPAAKGRDTKKAIARRGWQAVAQRLRGDHGYPEPDDSQKPTDSPSDGAPPPEEQIIETPSNEAPVEQIPFPSPETPGTQPDPWAALERWVPGSSSEPADAPESEPVADAPPPAESTTSADTAPEAEEPVADSGSESLPDAELSTSEPTAPVPAAQPQEPTATPSRRRQRGSTSAPASTTPKKKASSKKATSAATRAAKSADTAPAKAAAKKVTTAKRGKTAAAKAAPATSPRKGAAAQPTANRTALSKRQRVEIDEDAFVDVIGLVLGDGVPFAEACQRVAGERSLRYSSFQARMAAIAKRERMGTALGVGK